MARKVTVRRRRKNPMSSAKRKAAARKAAKTRARKKAARTRKRRKNPASRKQGKRVAGMFPASKKKGKKSAKKGKARKSKRRGRKYTKAGSLRKARAARKVTGKHSRSARTVIRRSKSKKARQVARTYMRARSVAKRAKGGRLGGEAGKLAKAYGLTRINPSIKGAMKDAKVMLPMIGVATLTVLGAAAAGMKAGAWISTQLPAATPAIVKRNAVPLTTMGLTLLAYAALKSSKGKMQKWAGPVMFGGAAATGIHWLMFSETGQKVAQKLGMPVTIANPMATAEGAAAMAQGKPAAGLGSYMAVSQYLGDFVSAGPQEAFGAYYSSDFPVHTPGPGDNVSVHASLGAYAGESMIDPGASFYGRSDLGEYNDPMLPTDEIGLEETPGGTMITSAALSGGLFGGSSSI